MTETAQTRPGGMSVEAARQRLGVGRSTIYKLVNEPGFPSFKVGRKIIVDREALEKWIDAQITASRNAQ